MIENHSTHLTESVCRWPCGVQQPLSYYALAFVVCFRLRFSSKKRLSLLHFICVLPNQLQISKGALKSTDWERQELNENERVSEWEREERRDRRRGENQDQVDKFIQTYVRVKLGLTWHIHTRHAVIVQGMVCQINVHVRKWRGSERERARERNFQVLFAEWLLSGYTVLMRWGICRALKRRAMLLKAFICIRGKSWPPQGFDHGYGYGKVLGARGEPAIEFITFLETRNHLYIFRYSKRQVTVLDRIY